MPSAQSEEGQEQITLATSIIGTCAGECRSRTASQLYIHAPVSSSFYPRLQGIHDLLKVIANHPRLARDATVALVDVCDAIKGNSSKDDIQVLLSGTLLNDANARNAALQALQVSRVIRRGLMKQPLDLTDFDYSVELWITTHDEDEQNVSLALRVWEENGLDVSEGFLPELTNYLGMS